MRKFRQVLCALAPLCLLLGFAGRATADPNIEMTGNYSHCTITQKSSETGKPLLDSIGDILGKVKFGAVGTSTIASDCSNMPDSSGDGLGFSAYPDAASNLGGATISYSNDKIQHKASTTFKGAVGYTISQTKNYGFTTIYYRIDNEGQSVSGSNSKSQNQDEYGFVYRSKLFAVNPFREFEGHQCDDNQCDLYFFIYAQPFILHDALRKSRSSDINLRFAPILPGINQFNKPIPNPDLFYMALYSTFVWMPGISQRLAIR